MTDTFLIGGDREVRRLGFGAMHLTGADRATAISVARRAVELGVTLIDTAHLYGWGANEELLAEALHPYPDDLLIATKVGVGQGGEEGWFYNGSPEFLRQQVDEALRRLRVERLELLQLHRVDPSLPVADQVGTLRDLRTEGKIGHIGLSEVTVEQLEEARTAAEIASVQNKYNLLDREEYEDVVDFCAANGIAFLPWRPVHPATGDTAVAEVAAELGATAAQVSLAWLLDRAPVVLPIPGTTSLKHLEENVAAADLRLTDDQRQRLNGL